MLTDPWIAALVSLFVWWFATGVILMAVKFADRRGPRTGQVLTVLTLPLLALGLWGIQTTSHAENPGAVYHAFLSGLAIWGWIELAFLTGTITGPNPHPCRDGVPGWERFLRAWGTIAHHEILLTTVVVGLYVYTQGAPNTFGFWTFAVLYFARISAKLNLFLGVPKINTEFLPQALSHLPSHFRTAPMNALFPLSVTGLSFAVACWLERIWSAQTQADVIGFALLAAMTALALLEHWFMVLPLPDEKLWRWMLPAPKPQPQEKTRPTEDAHGL